MTAVEIQTLINSAKTTLGDLVTWVELKAILEGLKNQDGEEGDYDLDMLGDVEVTAPLMDTHVLRWNGTNWDNQSLSTDDIAEGDNLFFTVDRVRGSFSAGYGISYNSATGVISGTVTQYTDAFARAAISLTTTGAGAATYNAATGVLNVPTPTSVNIYNADGTLVGNRTVTSGGFSINFTGAIFLGTATGNVGIGTTTPSYKLDVVVASGSSTAVRATNQTTRAFTQWESYTSANVLMRGFVGTFHDDSSFHIRTETSHPITFSTANTERMRIFANGNISVNSTTDAGFRLDVNGTTRFLGAMRQEVASGTTSRLGVVPNTTGNTVATDLLYADGGRFINFNLTVTGWNAWMSFSNVNGITHRNGNNSNGWTISDGVVDSKTFTLTNNNSTGGKVSIGNNGGTVFYISESNNVGIATTSPTTKLQVNGTISTNAYSSAPTSGFGLYMGHDGNEGGIFSYNYTTSAWLAISYSGLQHRFSTSGSDRMRIFSGGNISVNSVTDAGFRFDVNGTARVTDNFTMAGNNLYSSGRILISGNGGNNEYISILSGGTLNAGAANTGMIKIGSPTITGSSGSNIHASIDIGGGVVNTSSTWNGMVIGLYVRNPTITSLASGSYSAIRTSVASGISVWNLYIDGTAVNYMAGNLGIGTNAPSDKLHVIGSGRITGNTVFSTGSATMIIGNNGDSTYKLSVDGDIRVYGKIRTDTPTGGTGSGVWKLGGTLTGTFTVDTAICIEVEVNGTTRKIATFI
jgi:hypothetical protein